MTVVTFLYLGMADTMKRRSKKYAHNCVDDMNRCQLGKMLQDVFSRPDVPATIDSETHVITCSLCRTESTAIEVWCQHLAGKNVQCRRHVGNATRGQINAAQLAIHKAKRNPSKTRTFIIPSQ